MGHMRSCEFLFHGKIESDEIDLNKDGTLFKILINIFQNNPQIEDCIFTNLIHRGKNFHFWVFHNFLDLLFHIL